MPRGRPQPQLRVIGTNHFEDRWMEYINRPAKRLNRMLTSVLREQIGQGLRTNTAGQALLELNADALNLPMDMIVPLEPGMNGVWKALTIRPKRKGEYCEEPLPEIKVC